MPQMAPISWLSLFFWFLLVFFLFNMLNYYFFINLPAQSKIKDNLVLSSLNWKW